MLVAGVSWLELLFQLTAAGPANRACTRVIAETFAQLGNTLIH
jgi:hypothetical protein